MNANKLCNDIGTSSEYDIIIYTYIWYE